MAEESEWVGYGFSIVGVQKAGTTSLARVVNKHPQVAKAPRKEMHFFSREGHWDWADPPYDRYRVPRRRRRHRMAGDATPLYLLWPHALERMRDYNPDMRLIAVFRDPIERAFSQWVMIRRWHPDRLDWPEVLGRFRPTRPPEELPDDIDITTFRREGSLVARGYYGAQLARGLALFPREQWLLLDFRSMLRDFGGTLDRVTDHLGLARFAEPQVLPHAMAGAEKVAGTPPTPDEIAGLAALYSADLARFADLSGIDVSDWPTARVVAGDLEPEALAAKLADRVRASG